MSVRYKHTNIVANDWRKLAKFYEEIFGCEIVPPKRKLSGEWLEKGTGVQNASFEGAHLRLPGYEGNYPTLEIYQYEKTESSLEAVANRRGFGHIAFEVDDVASYYKKILENGGKEIAKITNHTVDGVGELTFVYVLDPEGNMIELQSWK